MKDNDKFNAMISGNFDKLVEYLLPRAEAMGMSREQLVDRCQTIPSPAPFYLAESGFSPEMISIVREALDSPDCEHSFELQMFALIEDKIKKANNVLADTILGNGNWMRWFKLESELTNILKQYERASEGQFKFDHVVEKISAKQLAQEIAKRMDEVCFCEDMRGVPFVWWDIDECGMGDTPGTVGYIQSMKFRVERIDDEWKTVADIKTKSNTYAILVMNLYFVAESDLTHLNDEESDVDFSELSPDHDLSIDVGEAYDLDPYAGCLERLTLLDDFIGQTYAFLKKKCLGAVCKVCGGDKQLVKSIEFEYELDEYSTSVSVNFDGCDWHDLSTLSISVY